MGKLDALWKYQQAELDKERLEDEIRNTPARLKLNKLRNFLSEQQTAIASQQKGMEQCAAQLEKVKERFEKLQSRQELELSELAELEKDTETTSGEAAELKRDLQTLMEEAENMRKELAEIIKTLEKTTEQNKETRSKAGKAKKEYNALRLVCEQEMADRSGELNESNAKVEELAKDVDPELMKKYKRIKKNHAAPMAELVEQKCGGCNMSLPTAVVKRVTGSEEPIECENCGRILYVIPS